MKSKLAALPHFFTLSNIFLGFLAIIYISRESFTTAAWCIIIATICDMLDGKMARLTKTYSRFGVELDSLADAISFGLAPAYLIYQSNFRTIGEWGVVFSFIFLLAGVFRLARFNTLVKGYAKKNYRGLPIPAAALAVVTFFIMAQQYWGRVDITPVFLVLVPGLSLLMVSSITYEAVPPLALSRSLKKNFKPMAYLGGFICIILYPRQLFFPGVMLYILYGIVNHCIKAVHSGGDPAEIAIDEEQLIK